MSGYFWTQENDCKDKSVGIVQIAYNDAKSYSNRPVGGIFLLSMFSFQTSHHYDQQCDLHFKQNNAKELSFHLSQHYLFSAAHAHYAFPDKYYMLRGSTLSFLAGCPKTDFLG